MLAAPARAQEVTTPPDEGDTRYGEQILVTAERRTTNLQDTPLSIVAVTQENVQAKGIDDLADLASFTPNLNITPSRGTGNSNPNFSIRGVSGGGGITGERGVGLYVDGVYVPRTSGSVLRVLDIDRIEVLRGPQGTLFGRNSTGGAIRIFTRQPVLGETEGYLRVTAASMDRRDVVGTVNLPIGEKAALRTQLAYLDQGGWVQRGSQDMGGSEDFVGRTNLRVEPTERFNVTLGFLYSHSKATGTPLVFEEFDMRPGIEGVLEGNFGDWLNDSFKQDGQAPLQPYNDPRIVRGPFTAPDICLLDDFDPDYDQRCDQVEKNTYWQADLRAELELSDTLQLSTITGVNRLKHTGSVDYQVLGTEDRATDVKSTTFYQELQLNASLLGGAVDLVAGLNYFHEKSEGSNLTINRRGTSAFPNRPNGNTDAGLFYLTDNFVVQKSDSFGVFTSATWHITQKLNFTGGLRFAYDRKKYEETEYASDNFAPVPGTDSTFVDSTDHWDQVDWRATLDYSPTSDWMIYATASKAYKAGQFSFTILDRVPGPEQSGDFIKTIPPEKVLNFEAGMRITAFDGRLRFNPTGFYMMWTNRQAARQVTCVVSTACPLGFEIQVVNSGDVDIYGAELDAQLFVTDDFWLDGSGGYTGYKLKDEVANSGPNLYPDVPKFNATAGANYRAMLGFGELTFNLNYSFTSKQATHPTDTGDSAYTLPAIGLFNARVKFVPDNAPVQVSVFANNLFDKTYATYAQRFGGGYWDQGGPANRLNPVALPERSALAAVRGKPREVGVTLQYDF
ncbi:conserved hypothetical protein [Altererythrobacter sp. B11]|nr:conserved hypothetical protein [Altererythrobacter sp. B11]